MLLKIMVILMKINFLDTKLIDKIEFSDHLYQMRHHIISLSSNHISNQVISNINRSNFSHSIKLILVSLTEEIRQPNRHTNNNKKRQGNLRGKITIGKIQVPDQVPKVDHLWMELIDKNQLNKSYKEYE